jgi:hypothetical protein
MGFDVFFTGTAYSGKSFKAFRFPACLFSAGSIFCLSVCVRLFDEWERGARKSVKERAACVL